MKLKLSAINVLFLSLSLGLVFPTSALAAASSEYQTCAPSTTCTVGEFLYDDVYAPIATATCTLTARYPDGTRKKVAPPVRKTLAKLHDEHDFSGEDPLP